MTNTQIRTTIRQHAQARDCRYRITRDGEVHYYGRMPNSIEIGWYLVDQNAETLARDIHAGRA